MFFLHLYEVGFILFSGANVFFFFTFFKSHDMTWRANIITTTMKTLLLSHSLAPKHAKIYHHNLQLYIRNASLQYHVKFICSWLILFIFYFALTDTIQNYFPLLYLEAGCGKVYSFQHCKRLEKTSLLWHHPQASY